MEAYEIIIVVIAAIAVVALLIACGAYWGYNVVFRAHKKSSSDPLDVPTGEQYDKHREKITSMIRDALSLPYESVSIKSRDGLTLFGKLYVVGENAPLRIMFHGYRSLAEKDFSGGIRAALEENNNVLLIDQRAHGKSQGKTICFGIKERYDCLEWVNYAVERFGKEQKIVLVGVSMGAATVLMASGLPLPKNVVGIIADCAFSSPREIILKVMKDQGYPRIMYFFVRLGAKLFGRFDPDETGAAEQLEKCNVPVFFVHGDDDRFVPYYMCLKNYEHCASEKTLMTVKGAGHALSYILEEERYKQEANAFVKKITSARD